MADQGIESYQGTICKDCRTRIENIVMLPASDSDDDDHAPMDDVCETLAEPDHCDTHPMCQIWSIIAQSRCNNCHGPYDSIPPLHGPWILEPTASDALELYIATSTRSGDHGFERFKLCPVTGIDPTPLNLR